jgi:hypothetical protein
VLQPGESAKNEREGEPPILKKHTEGKNEEKNNESDKRQFRKEERISNESIIITTPSPLYS